MTWKLERKQIFLLIIKYFRVNDFQNGRISKGSPPKKQWYNWRKLQKQTRSKQNNYFRTLEISQRHSTHWDAFIQEKPPVRTVGVRIIFVWAAPFLNVLQLSCHGRYTKGHASCEKQLLCCWRGLTGFGVEHWAIPCLWELSKIVAISVANKQEGQWQGCPEIVVLVRARNKVANQLKK